MKFEYAAPETVGLNAGAPKKCFVSLKKKQSCTVLSL